MLPVRYGEQFVYGKFAGFWKETVKPYGNFRYPEMAKIDHATNKITLWYLRKELKLLIHPTTMLVDIQLLLWKENPFNFGNIQAGVRLTEYELPFHITLFAGSIPVNYHPDGYVIILHRTGGVGLVLPSFLQKSR